MKKFLKYAGIFVVIAVVLLTVLMLMGQGAVGADKEALTRLQTDSVHYYEEKGTFVGFCSSNLYREIQKNFTYEIRCWNDDLEAGVQITVGLASEYFLCKPVALPPTNGKTLKKFACVQTPGPIFEAIR